MWRYDSIGWQVQNELPGTAWTDSNRTGFHMRNARARSVSEWKLAIWNSRALNTGKYCLGQKESTRWRVKRGKSDKFFFSKRLFNIQVTKRLQLRQILHRTWEYSLMPSTLYPYFDTGICRGWWKFGGWGTGSGIDTNPSRTRLARYSTAQPSSGQEPQEEQALQTDCGTDGDLQGQTTWWGDCWEA